MMNSIQIRDREARETLERMERDCERVSKRLQPILGAMIQDLFEPGLRLKSLWKRLGIRDHNISSHFVREVGMKPWDYVRDCRFEVAARMLRKSHLTITQISLVVGYVNYQSFSRSFEEWSGVRPIDCRKGREKRPLGPPPAEDPLGEADRALAAGSVAPALDFLEQAEGFRPRHDVEARRALAHHVRGVDRALGGDVDRAFDDLSRAERGYASLETLPGRVARHRRRLLFPSATDGLLLGALCPECRPSLAGDDEVRGRLRRALEPVPRDLEWFQRCCDPCYRVVWDALSRARLGQIQDAWQAWWISRTADPEDPETPPSLGRYVAALVRVERGAMGDQKERKRYADLALDDAVKMKRGVLEAQAHTWLGAVLREMGRLREARGAFRLATGKNRSTPWLQALHTRMSGILEINANNPQGALELLRESKVLYRKLDLHVTGLLEIQEGAALISAADYPGAVERFRAALRRLDDRRDPFPGRIAVPVNLANSFLGLQAWGEAEAELDRCLVDREVYPGSFAAELYTRACLMLGRGRPRSALLLFHQAREIFEGLERPLDVALVATYSVEAHARQGDRVKALENAALALKFFQVAGCPQDTLVALGKLRSLLDQDKVDCKAVSSATRELARRHGGCLPADEPPGRHPGCDRNSSQRRR